MKRKIESLHDKAIRLIEGGIVEINGHAVRAIKAPIDYFSCDVCDMDCLCNEVALLCREVDMFNRADYYLELVKYD